MIGNRLKHFSMVLAVATIVAVAPVRADVNVGPYIQNASPTAITIHWGSDTESKASVLFVPAGGRANTVSAAGRMHEKMEYEMHGKPVSSWLYSARVTGLRPDTPYTYTVRMAGSKDVSRSFHTWSENPERVTFIAYGDSRSYPAAHRARAGNFSRHKPDFILHTGDLVHKGRYFAEWVSQFFAPLHDVIDHIPLFAARGNHDGKAGDMLRVFDLPEGKTWYSFTYGPVHVVALDYGEEGKEVLDWLKTDLAASDAPWKICIYHVPTFNLGALYRADSARTTFLPIMEEHGVDFVLAGHSHQYERFLPMRRNGRDQANPITFITTAGGAASLYEIKKHRLHAAAARLHHYCVFSADTEKLSVEVIQSNDGKIDAFTVSKTKGRYDDAYLSLVQPMEAVIFTQGFMKTSTPAADHIPTKQRTATVTVAANFPGLTEPSSLTVELTDESRKHYASKPSTVDIEQEKMTTASLSIKAMSEITAANGSDGVLRPPLQLLLTARSNGIEETFKTNQVMVRKK